MTKDYIKEEWEAYAGWLKQFDDASATEQRNLINATLDLITEQEKEIERLKDENKQIKTKFEDYVCKDETEQHNTKVRNLELEKENKRLQDELTKQFKKLEKQAQKAIKQAKIEVLEIAKEKAIACQASGYDGIGPMDIDELIEEVKAE